jgi:hypothetical protein
LGEARLWRELHAELLHRLTSDGAPVAERRDALRVPCSIEVGAKQSAYRARNFGPGGLCIQGERLPAAGSELVLDWIAIEGRRRKFGVRTRVAWSHSHAAGLENQLDHKRHHRMVESLYSTLLEAFLHDV